MPMNSKITLVFLTAGILFSFFGCKKEEDLSFEMASLTEQDLSICREETCPEITIDYLKASGAGAVSEEINKKISNFIIRTLMLSEPDQDAATEDFSTENIESAAEKFVYSYLNDKAEFPDMAGVYFAEVSVSQLYTSDSQISLEAKNYVYTGGAHGYGVTHFLNFDSRTGKELTFPDLIKDFKGFTRFAENKFREQHHIKKETSLGDTGFWFPDNIFSLPDNFGISRDSLLFIYNQYEIASYAEGPIELKISKKEAGQYLVQNP